MKDHVKIAVIGDSQVGKSSLISTYASRHFPGEVPSVLTDCIIPAEATSNNVCVTLMDSSSSPNDREVLKQKILLADSIIAVYDCSRQMTLENLSTKWLPLIKDLNQSSEHSKPVIVVGAKMDLCDEEDEEIEKLNSLLKSNPFVLLCLRCSAAKLQDVSEVFTHSELLVTFPFSPLYDLSADEFKPACRRAFLRIFRIFDMDCDNLLSDSEICDTQYKCFNSPINSEELMRMKRQISKFVTGGLYKNLVTFEGYLGIVKMFIEQHQFIIPWTILRTFGYDDNLNLEVSFLDFITAI